MKPVPSALIFIILIFISSIFSIFICIKVTNTLSLQKRLSDFLLIILFFIIYAILLFVWIRRTKK